MATQETRDILLRLKLEGDSDLKKRNNELLISIQKNKEAIEQNNKSLKDYKAAGDTTSQAVNDLKIKNIELTNSNKSLGSELQNNIKIITNEVGALNEKRATLNNMNAAYAKLSADQKTNTAEGVAQGVAIRKLSDELKEEEKALGDTKRNVGNYTDSIIEANNQMGLGNTVLGKAVTGYKAFKVAALEASGGTSVLDGAMKLLDANPVFAIIAIAAGVFMLLKEAIGRNQEIVNKFTEALAPLKAIMGAVFKVVGDFVELIVTGLSAAMTLVTSLFGSAGKAANDYKAALETAIEAEKAMFNTKILQTTQQKQINDLMAVANNRMVDGKVRQEALTKAMEMQLGLANQLAEEQKKRLEGEIADLEAHYGLKNNLVNDDFTLTKSANDKLKQDDKDKYAEMLTTYLGFVNTESELNKERARKAGQIAQSILTDEKQMRDLRIAAMQDGLGKTLAAIDSNYKGQRDAQKVSYDIELTNMKKAHEEQYKEIQAQYARELKAAGDNELYKQFAKAVFEENTKNLNSAYFQQTQDAQGKQDEWQKAADAAAATERQKAARSSAKSLADAKLNLLRQAQDSEREAMTSGQQALIALEANVFQQQVELSNLQYATDLANLKTANDRKKEDLIKAQKEQGLVGINTKKETDAAIQAADKATKAEEKRLENEHQKALTEIINGNEIERAAGVIALKLDASQKGSDQEYKLKLQQLENSRQADILAAKQTGEDVALINAAYDEKIRVAKLENHQKILDEIKQNALNQIEIARQAGEDTFNAQITEKQNEIDTLAQMNGESDAAYIARQLKLKDDIIKIKQDQITEEERIDQAKLATAQAIYDSLDAMAQIFSDTSEKNAVFAKAMALFQIGLDTAVAMTTAIANAQMAASVGGPAAPALAILYTAQEIALVLGAVAKAKKVIMDVPKAPGKTTGGLITGAGSGTSDSIPIRASANESILTAQSTGMFAPLLSGLNLAGGGVAIQSVNKSQEVMGEQFLANAFMKALVAMPAPVLDLQEFHRADDRLTNIQENAVR